MIRRAMVAAGLASALAGGHAGAARAATVSVTSPPAAGGTATVGSTLNASGGSWSGPPGTAHGYAWVRCTNTTESSCALIAGTESSAGYTLVAADQGLRVRAALWAYYFGALAYRYSPALGPVAAAVVVTPTPTPTPTPEPPAAPVTQVVTGAVPGATGVGGFDISTPVAPASALPAKPRAPRMLRPFPVIRISGRLTATGAHVTRLTVRAPRGARIVVTCRGRGCPRRRLAEATALWHAHPFERDLRAGVRLTITVAKPGYLSKVTTIRIRRGRPPARTDLCLAPGAAKPSACPGN